MADVNSLPRRILMTRAPEDCAGVAGLLQPHAGTLAYYAPFTTRPVTLAPDVQVRLTEAAQDAAAGVVFTSPRAVEAMRQTMPALLAAWRQRPAFAVGPGTAETLQREGYTHVDAAAGDSQDLAARLALVSRQNGILKVYHLSGEVISADLAPLLPGGPSVERHVVYHADLRDVPADIAADLAAGRITDVVLLSARVAQHLLPLAKTAAALPQLHCLSQRVAEAAKGALAPAIPLVRVAPQPALAALLPLLALPPLEAAAVTAVIGND
jgi:uroporphyrinogen-III synthase